MNRLAIYLREQGHARAALPLARRALAVRRNAFGSSHNLVALSSLNLASLFLLLESREKARELLDHAQHICPTRSMTYYWLARLHMADDASDRREEIGSWKDFLRLERTHADRLREARQRLRDLGEEP